jgi:arginine decarboxylase
MHVSVADRFSTADAIELYGLDAWGNGYLAISDEGNLLVTPTRETQRAIDVSAVVKLLAQRGIGTPLLLRFPQLLQAQVEELAGSFQRAIAEYGYGGSFQPVFPMKVNQQRTAVEGLLASGARFGLGLEVGSRPELLGAAALSASPGATVICNGFKDREYLAAAALVSRLGRQVVVVIEKPFELDQILELAATGLVPPLIGFRIRLQARGAGLWEKSGGFASKFGLSTRQLLHAVDRLSQAGLSDRVALLHFHIGSQIPEIRKIKNAVREGGRIYAKLCKMGVPLRFLDVGGGLGIDYDGSKTSSDASVNYTVQEYANDVVFGVSDVCAEEGVAPPTILCESGRMLVAYHSMLVTDVRGSISGLDGELPKLTGKEPQVVRELAEVDRQINVKNYREFYHDALEYRDQMYSMFNLGMIDLEARAKAESLFWTIAHKTLRHSRSAKVMAEEFVELESRLHDKYICNFSVFQSLPDHWALDQLFPVVPIHRLNERPTRRASLVDITCDSDGEVDKFVHGKRIKGALEVHDLVAGRPYHLAFLLVGAYQDTMGDLHNLFGRVHEAEVLLEADGGIALRNVRRGELAGQALAYFGFEEKELVSRVGVSLDERVKAGQMETAEAATLLDDYKKGLRRYTYLG